MSKKAKVLKGKITKHKNGVHHELKIQGVDKKMLFSSKEKAQAFLDKQEEKASRRKKVAPKTPTTVLKQAKDGK